MKKHSDGNYYEKIVTWKEEPNSGNICIGIILMLLTLLLFLFEANSIIGWLMGFFFVVGLIVLFDSFGEGKKVKFRKIGK